MENEPITREEILLNAVATGEAANLDPITRKEMFLAKLGGADVNTPTPITREEWFLQKAIENGGSGGSGGGSSADVRYVTFKSEDGSTTYGKKAVAAGDDCADPIARGVFDRPTKEPDAQHTYTFYSWATTPNGAADSNWNKAVTEDRTVYANFASVVRYYTVSFYDGDTLLTTKSVAYGGTATYSPPAKDGYFFDKWEPVPENITGDMDCYAQYKALSIEGLYQTDSNYTVRIMSWKQMVDAGYIDSSGKLTADYRRSGLEGDIALPNDATSVPAKFAYSASNVTGVLIPNSVTTIGNSAFSGCMGLKNVTFAEGIHISEIPYESFRNCYVLPYIEIPDGVTTIKENAFHSSTLLASVKLPATVKTFMSAVFYQTALADIDFGGTCAQWNAIVKPNNWNHNCPAITVTCTDGTVTVPASGT